MNTEIEQLLEDTKQRLFQSDEFRVSRDLIQWTQRNSGKQEDLEVLLELIDRFTPAMRQWADSFDEAQPETIEE
jgi:hypothetical protein